MLGLSFGISSSVLLHIIGGYIESIVSRRRREPFQLHVVYVDASLSPEGSPDEVSRVSQILDRYAQGYPQFTFQRMPLTAAIGLQSIDWSALPPLKPGAEPAQQLRGLLDQLPSTTSRADILRLLIRHVLLSSALEHSCQAVLLGHSTTALAELTLSETAKGRGFSLPWQISDGAFSVRDTLVADDHVPEGSETAEDSMRTVRIHYPLRELLRKELVTYTTLTEPPLTELIPEEAGRSGSIVSHRDLSIEEVMARYFEGVEENYPSIVANVVRTTAKLHRAAEDGDCCGVCGMPSDEQGEERWKGEIGESRAGRGERSGISPSRHLCHGCQRSIHG